MSEAAADILWRRAYEEARRALPDAVRDLPISFEQFVAYCENVGASSSEIPVAQLAELLLVCACGTGSAGAIAELERGYLLPARASLFRFSKSDDFIDEVLQELRAKLLVGPDARIARFSGRGPLAAWIRVAASRVAIDVLRAATGPAANAVPETDPMSAIDLGPEVQLLRGVYRDAFQGALAAALADLEPRDRTLLRRHIVEKLTLQEIAVPQRVHAATIARRLASLRDQIADAVRARLSNRHPEQGGPTGLESLARAIRSEIDLSLGPLLATRPPTPASRPPDEPSPEEKQGKKSRSDR